MAIDGDGNVLVQEDPGGNAYLARILSYRIDDGAIGIVARFDPARFGVGTPGSGFLTVGEESSGIIEISKGTFLFDAQVDKARAEPELDGEGQLLTLTVDDWDDV